MSAKKIIGTYPAVAAHMPGLSTWRAMPTQHIEWVDPFLFLNHHGPDHFQPYNRGLPFGPHPHRGFETLTYILDGELVHQDTTGFKSRILEGGVQWMTAGSGLLHSETSSVEFLKEGGNVELIQLWLNLPKRLKMTKPNYVGLQKDELVHFSPAKDVEMHLISGSIFGETGPMESITNLTMSWLTLKAGSTITLPVPDKMETLFYQVKGTCTVNDASIQMRTLVRFDQNEGEITVKADEDSTILFGYGLPFNEPIAAQGPFVMNTYDEIENAIRDYQMGKMGVWPES